MERRNEADCAISTENAQRLRDISLRRSGMTIQQYETMLAERLIRQIQKKHFNPNRWIPIERIGEIHARYGLTAPDDLIISQVETEYLKQDNPGWTPPGVKTIYHDKVTGKPIERVKEAKSALAVRLNPEKYRHLMSL